MSPPSSLVRVAFLSSLANGHEFWCGAFKAVTASSFQAAYSGGFLPMFTESNSLHSLGVEGIDTGPFGDCPICAGAPQGGRSEHAFQQCEFLNSHIFQMLIRIDHPTIVVVLATP